MRAGLRPGPLDGGRHASDRPRRPGRHHPADQRAILGPAGPDGFYLACGFSGTGFKTAPAVGACLAELILDGRATTVDIAGYSLDRFAEGRLLVGEHPYGALWR